MSFTDSMSRLSKTPAFKFIIVGILTFALMIPLLFVYFMVSERESFSRKATREVGRMWAHEQTIRGPFFIVPVIKRHERVNKNGTTTTSETRKLAVVLPERVNLELDTKTKELKRGIYAVPVYEGKMRFSGHFKPLDLKKLKRDADEIVWDQAVFALAISDVRGIKKTAAISLADIKDQFRAGLGPFQNALSGIHFPVSELTAKPGFKYNFELQLNGSAAIDFVPAGGETEILMTSDWPHPSFSGNFLPVNREISANGFRANWTIPRLARGTGQYFQIKGMRLFLERNLFGVDFYQPLDFYDLVGRALKYALGFIAIVFLSVFIMEVQAGRPVHWIQYVFVGLALVIFYLVLLGLAEHIGFELAYGLATIATALLIGAYCASSLKSTKKGFVLGAVIALIYGLLYLLLRVEDYALLIGSIASFVLLAIVMYSTRNVDWSGYQHKQAAKSEIS